MQIIQMLLKEMKQEAKVTRKFLEALPNDHLCFKPHTKSQSMEQLANHLAELPGWVSFGLNTEELDFSKNHYEPPVMKSSAELLAGFEKAYQLGISALEAVNEADLEKAWTMRNGETVYSVMTKAELIRMAFCQTVHHRAQLGVYFRLLDIPVPPSYGPTADFPDAH